MRIIFVDDEEKILNGLRRMLRSHRKEWKMHFFTSASEAIEFMKDNVVDMVISDMRMPEIDGAKFLEIVKDLNPTTVRIILSGQSKMDSLYKSLGVTHQFLAKPCEPEKLISTIKSAQFLIALLSDIKIKKFLSKINTLPSIPQLYDELMTHLKSDDVSMKRIGEIISQDIGMTAKILQLVNSAFFGLPHRITNPATAANLLGMDVLLNMVLSVKVFSRWEIEGMSNFSLEEEWKHCMVIADYSMKICDFENCCRDFKNQVFIASILHDCGKLILAENFPDIYDEMIYEASNAITPLTDIEYQEFGVSHSELGAYLMGTWGLHNYIVETIAYHHNPDSEGLMEVSPLTVVYFANNINRILGKTDDILDPEHWDLDYLDKVGVLNKMANWINVCLSTGNQEIEHERENTLC